ncbi:hypothetical protein B0H15DRAFT_952766 [Mycena belliarum]|uniref:RING-type domain-containing protein n=1 Tax=Mycena belliarum TaxID=1033014 RepID=A0AAD6TXV4_9AGAR|nr:hypothetical protein B0H15DRAFT_952766 [Mycena belliae]
MSRAEQGFYHAWQGRTNDPINVEAGSASEPFDVDRWCRLQEVELALVKAESQRFECSICLDTLYQPVLVLCLHRFCYGCLLRWFKRGKDTCPYCTARLKEAPIRDNGFEMDLVQAITSGVVSKSALQTGAKVTTVSADYDWSDIVFNDD